MSNVAEVIQKRSSTRGYTVQPLTDAEITALLHAGLQAPTATNRQEVHFSVVKGDHPILKEIDAEKNRLRGIVDPPNNFYFDAPIVIILSAERDFKWSSVDAGIAVQNIALMAEELGLGSVIVGSFRDVMLGENRDYFEKALQVPSGYEYKIAIAVGHKAVEKEPHTYNFDKQVSFCK